MDVIRDKLHSIEALNPPSVSAGATSPSVSVISSTAPCSSGTTSITMSLSAASVTPKRGAVERKFDLSVLYSEPWINHLKADLHVNAVYIGPVCESLTHGYDTVDFLNVDNRLGTNQDMINLAKEYKRHNIRIVIDAVFNHVGRSFWAFVDVLERREKSRYRSWFSGLKFRPSHNGHHHGHDDDSGISYDTWHGHRSLVKLNVDNPEVREYILKVIRVWRFEWGVSGLRLDAADCLSKDFVAYLRTQCDSMRAPDESNSAPDQFLLLGEISHGDYSFMGKTKLHTQTNYDCYKGLYSSHNDFNLFEIAHSMERLFGPNGLIKGESLYNFVDNHDVNRIASVLKNQRHLLSIHVILYTMPGVPSIYYGSEFGLTGKKGHGNQADQPLRPSLDLGQYPMLSDCDKSHCPETGPQSCRLLQRLFEVLGRIRQSSEGRALREGEFSNYRIRNGSLIIARTLPNESVYIGVNITDEVVDVELKDMGGAPYFDLFEAGKRVANNRMILQPLWASILYVCHGNKEYSVSPVIRDMKSIDRNVFLRSVESMFTK